MKKLAIAVASVALLAVALYLGGRSIVQRFEKRMLVGKSPRNAIGTVLKKEHIRGTENQGTGTLDGERFFVYYRLDDFHDITAAEREAVLKKERLRFAKDGPRKMEVLREEYEALAEGRKITVRYAYYPSVLWAVSSEIRVPW